MTTATESPHRIHDLETLEQKLAQKRDELRVKMHLARADARDQYDRVEEQWLRFRGRMGDLRRATGEAGEDLAEGARALGKEIAEGYERIRKAL